MSGGAQRSWRGGTGSKRRRPIDHSACASRTCTGATRSASRYSPTSRCASWRCLASCCVARHWSGAEAWEEALPASLAAADAAFALYAFRSAKEHWTLALEAAARLGRELSPAAVGPFMQRLSPPPPPPDAPSPLRFAPPGKLVDALTAAGFGDTREERRSMVLPWPGPPDELWQHIYDIAIPLRPLFDGLSGDERAAALAEAVARYAKHYDGRTVNVPASIVTVSART